MRDESVAALGHATVKRMTSVMAERQRLAAAVADMKRESHAPSELGSEVPASATAQIIAERDTEIDVVSSRMHDDIARLERSVSDIHQQLMDERRRSSVLDSEVERLAAALAGAKKYAKDVEFERDRLRTKIDVYRKEYCSVHEKCDALEEANLEFAAENKRLVSALDRAENALWEIAATRCSGTVAQEREVNYRDNLDEDESTVDRTERLIRGPYEFECAHASARMPVAVASCSAVDGDPPSRVMSTLASPVVKAESPDDVWGWALYDGASEGIAEKYRDEVYTADAVDTSAIYPLLLPGDDDDDEVGIMITEAELEARGPCPRLASAETRRDAGARVNALQLSLEAPDDDQTLSKSLTVTKSSYALGRALELLDQARAKAGQLRADLHEAQARESAVSRELARALVRLGDPT
jgi:predicted  nucleic acid-binding Zn-ribbon protein